MIIAKCPTELLICQCLRRILFYDFVFGVETFSKPALVDVVIVWSFRFHIL